jgi:hypothetical protein
MKLGMSIMPLQIPPSGWFWNFRQQDEYDGRVNLWRGQNIGVIRYEVINQSFIKSSSLHKRLSPPKTGFCGLQL